jgi:alkyl hydroperoxide reductase subunit AhpF
MRLWQLIHEEKVNGLTYVDRSSDEEKHNEFASPPIHSHL